MKALACADLHININNRFEDTEEILRQIIKVAIDECVDQVWILGDVYDKKRPYNSERVLFHEFVKSLTSAHKHVTIISGNHDTDQFNVSALDEFRVLNLPNVSYLPNPSVLDVGYSKIYLGHHLVTGAKLGASEFVAREGLNIQTILKTEADLYLLGDVHKAQKLHTEPDMLYVGSPERITFSERDELKGVVIVEVSNVDIKPRYTFYPLKPRDMIQIDISIESGIIEYAMVEHEDAIIKMMVTCEKEDYNKFDESEIRENFKDAYSIKFEYKILKEDRKRKSNISESTNPIEAFVLYGTTIDLDDSTIELGKKIIENIL